MRFSEAHKDIGQAAFPGGVTRAAAIITGARTLRMMHAPGCSCGTGKVADAVAASARGRMNAARRRFSQRRAAIGIRPYGRVEHAIEIASYEVATKLRIRNFAGLEPDGPGVMATFTFWPNGSKVVQIARFIPSHAVRSNRLLAEEIAASIGRIADLVERKEIDSGPILEWRV
jgi:hypothetical protein